MFATQLADIDAKFTSDHKTCLITASVVLSNNRLVLVDAENKKVKLIYLTSGEHLDSLGIIGCPFGVTKTTKDHVAVTVPNKKKLLFIHVTDRLVKEREINVSGRCRGVAYTGGNQERLVKKREKSVGGWCRGVANREDDQERLVVTFQSPYASVEVMDLEGVVRHTMRFAENWTSLFANPMCVCINPSNQMIYVSEGSDASPSGFAVKSFTLDGQARSVYRDEELSCPRQLCTDQHGHVFVCGMWTRTVHVITGECEKVKVMLSGEEDGLQHSVVSVSHCRETDMLFVGTILSDVVKVYQIVYKT